MKDPYHTKIIFEIESLIHEFDKKSDGKFTDSDAKSAIRKTLSMLKGKRSSASPKNERERVRDELSVALFENFSLEEQKTKLSKPVYRKILLVTEKSLETRRGMDGHSRGYLDFLEGFLEQARSSAR